MTVVDSTGPDETVVITTRESLTERAHGGSTWSTGDPTSPVTTINLDLEDSSGSLSTATGQDRTTEMSSVDISTSVARNTLPTSDTAEITATEESSPGVEPSSTPDSDNSTPFTRPDESVVITTRESLTERAHGGSTWSTGDPTSPVTTINLDLGLPTRSPGTPQDLMNPSSEEPSSSPGTRSPVETSPRETLTETSPTDTTVALPTLQSRATDSGSTRLPHLHTGVTVPVESPTEQTVPMERGSLSPSPSETWAKPYSGTPRRTSQSRGTVSSFPTESNPTGTKGTGKESIPAQTPKTAGIAVYTWLDPTWETRVDTHVPLSTSSTDLEDSATSFITVPNITITSVTDESAVTGDVPLSEMTTPVSRQPEARPQTSPSSEEDTRSLSSKVPISRLTSTSSGSSEVGGLRNPTLPPPTSGMRLSPSSTNSHSLKTTVPSAPAFPEDSSGSLSTATGQDRTAEMSSVDISTSVARNTLPTSDTAEITATEESSPGVEPSSTPDSDNSTPFTRPDESVVITTRESLTERAHGGSTWSTGDPTSPVTTINLDLGLPTRSPGTPQDLMNPSSEEPSSSPGTRSPVETSPRETLTETSPTDTTVALPTLQSRATDSGSTRLPHLHTGVTVPVESPTEQTVPMERGSLSPSPSETWAKPYSGTPRRTSQSRGTVSSFPTESNPTGTKGTGKESIPAQTPKTAGIAVYTWLDPTWETRVDTHVPLSTSSTDLEDSATSFITVPNITITSVTDESAVTGDVPLSEMTTPVSRQPEARPQTSPSSEEDTRSLSSKVPISRLTSTSSGSSEVGGLRNPTLPPPTSGMRLSPSSTNSHSLKTTVPSAPAFPEDSSGSLSTATGQDRTAEMSSVDISTSVARNTLPTSDTAEITATEEGSPGVEPSSTPDSDNSTPFTRPDESVVITTRESLTERAHGGSTWSTGDPTSPVTTINLDLGLPTRSPGTPQDLMNPSSEEPGSSPGTRSPVETSPRETPTEISPTDTTVALPTLQHETIPIIHKQSFPENHSAFGPCFPRRLFRVPEHCYGTGQDR
ncbi:uncharacterized protein ACIGJ3_018735 [Trichechus inunguis]